MDPSDADTPTREPEGYSAGHGSKRIQRPRRLVRHERGKVINQHAQQSQSSDAVCGQNPNAAAFMPRRRGRRTAGDCRGIAHGSIVHRTPPAFNLKMARMAPALPHTAGKAGLMRRSYYDSGQIGPPKCPQLQNLCKLPYVTGAHRSCDLCRRRAPGRIGTLKAL